MAFPVLIILIVGGVLLWRVNSNRERKTAAKIGLSLGIVVLLIVVGGIVQLKYEGIPNIAVTRSGSTGSSNVVTRDDLIKQQFNPWDGSHINLEAFIKQNMNDPDSYEHIATTYVDDGNNLIVTVQFRGKNSFGAKVINRIKAKVDIMGNIVEILK